VVVVPPPPPPLPDGGPIVTPTLTTRRHSAKRQASPEELQYRAVQQYGRNVIEGGQRVLPPYVCVGSGCVR
jgi:hypothetical protein